MARLINLSTPESGVTDGMELSFRAPCNCADANGISLDGVTYDLVDASGNSLTSCSGYFVKDAILTVIIDTVNGKATLLNPNVNNYTKTLGTPDDTASASGGTLWSRVKQIIADLSNKAAKVHTHTKSEITDFAHNHDDRYYTETETNNLLNGKANSTHTHDDRYYTETETNNLLSKKSDTGHTHTKSQITDFAHSHNDLYYTKTEMNTSLGGKANTGHNHNDIYYLKSDIDTKIGNLNTTIGGKAPATHTHTKSQITDFAHNHNDIYYTETEIDSKIATINTAISGKSDSNHTHDGRYYTETEIDTKLAGKSDSGHNHNDVYYTETEIDSKLGSYYTKSQIDTQMNNKATATSVNTVQSQVNNIISGSTTVGKAKVAGTLSTTEINFNSIPSDGVTWVPTAGKTYVITNGSCTYLMTFPSSGLKTMTSTHDTYNYYFCWRNTETKPNNLYYRSSSGEGASGEYVSNVTIREI